MKKRREMPDKWQHLVTEMKKVKRKKIKVRQRMTDDKNFSLSAGGLSGECGRGE